MAIFCDFFSELGGTEYYNFQLIKKLKKNGFEIKVLIGERPRKTYWINLLKENNIEYYYPKRFHENLLERKIEEEFIKDNYERILRWNPHIIHTNPGGKLALAWFEANRGKGNIPMVATEWTNPGENTKYWYPKDFKNFVNYFDAYIATCEVCKKGIEDFHEYKGKIYIIPHLIQNSEKKSFNYENNEDLFSVGCVSRLSPEKGLVFLLGAWKKVIFKYPKANLHIYGDGNEKRDLVQLSKALGIEKNIFFDGIFEPGTGIDKVCEKHKIFIQPSLFESIPTSIIELMLRKKVVIATNVGGIPEIIRDKENGFICEAGSTEAIYKKIISLFEKEYNIENIGEIAYKDIKKDYDIEINFRKILKVYENVLKRGKYNEKFTRCTKE